MEVSRHLSIDYSQVSAAAHHRHLAAEEADALSKKLASSVRVDSQDTWHNHIFPFFSSQGDSGSDVRGYHGLWRFYKPLGTHEACISQQFRCIRTYLAHAVDGMPQILFRNFHDGTATFVSGGTSRREVDGLYVDQYVRYMSDPYFSSQMMKLDESEEAEGLPAACFRRSVAVKNLDVVVRVPPALPPKPVEPAVGVGAGQAVPDPNNKQAPRGPSAWGFECFLQDGDCRWSMGPMYNMHNLEFLSHFFIQEYLTAIDPEKAIDMNKMPWRAARPRLDGATNMWMDGGKWVGTMTDLIWDEDGEMFRLNPRTAVWTPPDPLRRTHRLYLYDDSMYAYYPAKQLPAVDDTVEPTFANGVRFEVGGLMRSEEMFKRAVVRYSINGSIESITEEVYRPPPPESISVDNPEANKATQPATRK